MLRTTVSKVVQGKPLAKSSASPTASRTADWQAALSGWSSGT